MNIRLHQLNPVIGDLEGNKNLILSALENAEKENIDLLIVPEMVVTGYPAQDLLERVMFREACYQVNKEIIQSTGKTALLFGSLMPNESGMGRKMFNSAILAKDGQELGHTFKTLLPTYDVFDDLRYFEPNDSLHCLELNGIKLGVTICEDIWYNENEVQYHYYEINPAKKLKDAGAQVIINISASPYTVSKHENRKEMLCNHATKLQLPVLYCNQVGAHTDIVFDGDSMAVEKNGNVLANTLPFEASFTDFIFDEETSALKTRQSKIHSYPATREERQFLAIKVGLYDYLHKTGAGLQVVLGLSGGIDSALACTLATAILGPENVKVLTMPGEFSSEGSITDSQLLADNLGIEPIEIPIGEIYDQFNHSLSPLFEGLEFGTAEENLQSRIRGTLLMAYSNKFGHFLLATGNKSEYAVGYATLYGDMAGAIAIIGDLYKTEVYKMTEWLNQSYYGKEVIPRSIITKAPSAELRPNQKDSDSLPDYDTLDRILFQYIELQKSVDEITDSGIDRKVIRNIVKLVDRQEFKRYQAAPIIKLSSKSFGTGRRWPLVQDWTRQQK